MTVTEASRDLRVADAAAEEPAPRAGLAALVGTGDPRSIGKLFVGTSLLFLLITGVTGALVGFERIDLDSFDILAAGSFAQVVTFHQVAGLFLVVMPLLLGLALAVVPLQVGASTVAFPRAAAVGYWTYLVAGGLLVAAYLADGGPFGGDNEAVGLFVVAFIALIVALCAVTVSVATTVLSLRAPGMTLRRTPLFAWSMLVAAALWLLTLPVLAALLALYYMDITYGDQALFSAGPADLHDQIRWVFWQPALYAFAIPALGIIGDIVPVFAQRRHSRHGVALVLIGLFGALSFGAWAQIATLPTTGQAAVSADDVAWLYEWPWAAVSIAALVPVLGLLGLWTLTLLKGKMRLSGPLLLAISSGFLLAVGVAAGIGTAVPALDLFGTSWMMGQAYAVVLAAVVAALAGLVFWAPKLYGKLLPDGLAKMLAPVFVLGGLVLAVPYAIGGLLDQPWPVETFVDHGAEAAEDADTHAVLGHDVELDESGTVEVLNLVAAIGGVVVLVGAAALILSLMRRSPARNTPVEDDPWNGNTLEWTTTSPPAVGNFAEVLEITSEAPLYDKRHAEATDQAQSNEEVPAR